MPLKALVTMLLTTAITSRLGENTSIADTNLQVVIRG
jgi:hypothetical protein